MLLLWYMQCRLICWHGLTYSLVSTGLLIWCCQVVDTKVRPADILSIKHRHRCWSSLKEVKIQWCFTTLSCLMSFHDGGVSMVVVCGIHDDVFKWKHFLRYWPFVREIRRSPVNSPHKGQWRGPLMFSLICNRINGWVNNREAGYLRRYRAHYDVIVMIEL